MRTVFGKNRRVVLEEMSDGFDYLGKLTGRLCVMYLIRR
jgi:hypothetical protein